MKRQIVASMGEGDHPVKAARLAKGWRLEDLSQRLHKCSKPLLSNIEHGYVPKAARMEEIAKALDTTPEILWPGEYEAAE